MTYFKQTSEEIKKIVLESESLEEAVRQINKIVYASYQNGLKAKSSEKPKTKKKFKKQEVNPFYQDNENEYE